MSLPNAGSPAGGNPRVSVVVPTYNRGSKLAATLERLLESDVSGLGPVEVVVVDDGSDSPAAPFVELCRVPPSFALRSLRQANAGPAAARNAGFRSTSGEIVLFVDDDILMPLDGLQRHVEAHGRFPATAVCGRCPFEEPATPTPLYRFLVGRESDDPGRASAHEYVEVPLVASGQISVERVSFAGEGRVYREDLVTPAAEEFELSHRLSCRGIKILLATQIVAAHLQEVDIARICLQQYKHGLGCGEVAVKCPTTLELRELETIVERCGPGGSGPFSQRWAAGLKAVASDKPLRAALLRLARWTEALRIGGPLLRGLYHAAISAHFIAGVRDGLRHYAQSDPSAPRPKV